MHPGRLKYIVPLGLLVATAAAWLLFKADRTTPEKNSVRKQIDSLNTLTVNDTTAHFIDHYNDALALAKQAGSPGGEVSATLALGDHYSDYGNFAEAHTQYEAALRMAREHRLNDQEISSLHKIAGLLTAENETQRADSLYTTALTLSQHRNDSANIAVSFEELGTFYAEQRDDQKALDAFHTATRYTTRIHDSSNTANCYNNIGYVYYTRGEYLDCIRYYDSAMKIKQQLHEEYPVAQALLNIGIAYKEQGYYDLAFNKLVPAAKYFEEHINQKELASCYNAMGNVQIQLGSFEKALTYHQKALDIRRQIDNKEGIANTLTNLGYVYMKQGDYVKAMDYLGQSVVVKTALQDNVLLGSSLDFIGETYLLQNKPDTAERYFIRSLHLKNDVEDPKGVSSNHNNLGELYLRAGKYAQASAQLDSARTLAMKSGLNDALLKNYDLTIRLSKATNNPQQTIQYYELYTSLKNRMFDEQKNKALSEMQIKYETGQKEQSILLLKERDKSQTLVVSKQTTFIYSLIGFAILLSVIILLVWRAYRARRKAHAQSQELVRQKQTMLSELHHRVKNNLQVLSALVGLQQDRVQDDQSKEALKGVEHRLDAMLFIHSGLYGTANDAHVSLREYIGKLTDNLLSSYGYDAAAVRLDIDIEEISLDADVALNFGFICNEIISNSMKHAFPKRTSPELRIRIWNETGNLHLLISDNGPGLPENSDSAESNSFGLRLIRLFAEELNAETRLSSDSNGMCFELVLPLTSKAS